MIDNKKNLENVFTLANNVRKIFDACIIPQSTLECSMKAAKIMSSISPSIMGISVIESAIQTKSQMSEVMNSINLSSLGNTAGKLFNESVLKTYLQCSKMVQMLDSSGRYVLYNDMDKIFNAYSPLWKVQCSEILHSINLSTYKLYQENINLYKNILADYDRLNKYYTEIHKLSEKYPIILYSQKQLLDINKNFMKSYSIISNALEMSLDLSETVDSILDTICKDEDRNIMDALYKIKWWMIDEKILPENIKLNIKNIIIENEKYVETCKELIDEMLIHCLKEPILKIIESFPEKIIDLPDFTQDTILDAIDLYKNNNYNGAAMLFITHWEYIIKNKIKRPLKEKKSLIKQTEMLLENSNFNESYIEFFKQYIFYKCNSEDDIIDDVPGRHAFIHGHIKNRVSEKLMFNSIFITNFLLGLESINE